MPEDPAGKPSTDASSFGRSAPATAAGRTLPLSEAEAPRRDHLPHDVTSFIGRGADVLAGHHLLEQHRLVTLTGTGGVGKTRLAVQVARGLVGRFADGARWVELGALADAGLIHRAVAGAVGVEMAPDRPPRIALADALRPLSVLLVLDNCEHLALASAQLVEELLHACPQRAGAGDEPGAPRLRR